MFLGAGILIRKKKDLDDVIDFHKELTTGRNNWKFLSNSYKGMPPVGMQMFAPLLINLTTEVSKVNECIPKFLDIRSEVLNTADTVRKMNIELIDIKDKFNKAVVGMEEATNNIADEELSVLSELRSFRQSIGAVGNPAQDSEVHRSLLGEENNISGMNREESVDASVVIDRRDDDAAGINISDGTFAEGSGDVSLEPAPLPLADNVAIHDNVLYSRVLKKMKQTSSNPQGLGSVRSFRDGKIAGSARDSRSTYSAPNRLVPGRGRPSTTQRGSNSVRLMGARKDYVSSFRAVKRTVDVFIGRVHKEADEDVIKNYIKETFNIDCNKVEKLQIKTDLYNAFKVTVSFTERDALFKPDMWPEDVVVKKFLKGVKIL